jgi:phosphopantetheinyl transferase
VHPIDSRPSPVPAERIYADRWLFHGPEYQGITEITEFGDDGICGWLRSQAAPGALLDNAGQLLGYWVAAVVERDRLVLPTSIDRISYHGPHPEPGTRVFCSVRITDIGPRSVRGDLELTVDGVVWCRIDGWEDRRFDTDEVIFRMLRRPERNVVSEIRPGSPRVAVATERWTDSATRDIVRRRYLRESERDEYDQRNPRAQREWLLGRVALKDLVRTHLWDQGAGELYPGELIVGNDPDGRPTLTGPVPDDVQVSVAHTDGVGVAALCEGGPAGIDVEQIEARSDTFVASILTAGEQALARPAGDDADTWVTRLWCAKEAAAKAAGTGLQGAPKSWEVTASDGTDLCVGGQWVATEVLRIPHHRDPVKEYVLAWTTEH